MDRPLALFRDENAACDGCGGPPEPAYANGGGKKFKPLLVCQSCKMACYHNRECQMTHWKKGHKKVCILRKKSGLLQPIQSVIDCLNKKERVKCFLSSYFQSMSNEDLNNQEAKWADGLNEWKQGAYLNGMSLMQNSLDRFMSEWNDFMRNGLELRQHTNGSFNSGSGLIVTRRILFLSYCEMDGRQIESARSKLVACISMALSIMENQASYANRGLNTIVDDALHELMLSYEEEDETHKRSQILDEEMRSWCARQVAHVAIKHHRCSWLDPYQRPGYMTPPRYFVNGVSEENISFLERSRHPTWCRKLEEHWEEIREECFRLMNRSNDRVWSNVGDGDRDSGHTDHRVVDGGKWTELVLFGSGETNVAPLTRRLVATHAPEAVSLAREGGGEVILSRLAPGTHIQPHCGPTDLRLTAHLGLLVPHSAQNESNGSGSVNSCRIRVRNEWYSWKQGEMLVFDDSYEHEVRNDTNEERVVLLLRFWHPMLDPSHRRVCLAQARERKGESVEKRYHPPTDMFPGY